MKKKIWLLVLGFVYASIASQIFVRYPFVSGQFYPGATAILKKDIETYLANAEDKPLPASSKVLGMIVPHAGYQYSGQTAAYAYNILKNQKVDVIVLIGPYHANHFSGVSIWPEGKWITPLGDVSVDEELAQNLRNVSRDFQYDYQIHISEHSLEVQIPFIQTVAKDTKIVPILISDLRYAKPLAQALHKHLSGRSAIILASTDLSHYHPDSMAKGIDQRTQDIVRQLSPAIFREAYEKGDIELCGAAAVLTLLELTKLSGQGECINLHYATSGDQFSDKSSVVGYDASLISITNKISLERGQELLKFAKDSLYAYLANQVAPTLLTDDPVLKQHRAVFVTLRDKTGKLRGCIGRLQAEEPLFLAVQHMAIEAATKDTRFSPVTLNELKNMSIEISVLDGPVRIENVSDIRYGTHGVIVTQGYKSGVFLPEVSLEFRNKEEFLSELCFQKADLPRNCWQNPMTQLSVFTTQIIH